MSSQRRHVICLGIEHLLTDNIVTNVALYPLLSKIYCIFGSTHDKSEDVCKAFGELSTIVNLAKPGVSNVSVKDF